MLAVSVFLFVVITSHVESVSASEEDVGTQVRMLLSQIFHMGKLQCYECPNCDEVDKSTPKKKNCGACVKAVTTKPVKIITRGCVGSCEGLPKIPNTDIYCCESELCNSTTQIKSNLKLICFTLLVFIIAKYFQKLY
uniref:UPAR/Ly6 domain-containing protein n=1 Tax=Trichobilharzia regenti TaxID=157069 RepID=A0AA85JSX2_TRIRE|nr:unnamed protein product [Trichobilharzia regenti]